MGSCVETGINSMAHIVNGLVFDFIFCRFDKWVGLSLPPTLYFIAPISLFPLYATNQFTYKYNVVRETPSEMGGL